MRIFLITGVAGFIGSNLATRLINDGYKVFGIDNFSYGKKSNLDKIINHKNFTFIEGDISNPYILKPIKADAIIHLASQKIPRYTNSYRTLGENYDMLENVIQKCLADKSKLFFASTSDVYGKNPKIPFTEESDLLMGPTNVKRWAYAISKMYGEHKIIANSEENDLNYTIFRYFGSYGPNQNLTWLGGPQSLFIKHAFDKTEIEIHGDGKQTRTFTYIEDNVNEMMHCINSEKSDREVFNIASDYSEEITILDLAKLIWRLVNGENSEPLLNLIPLSTFGKYEDVKRRVPSIEKIKSYFGYNTQFTLKEGLKRTIEWQRKIR